MNLVMYEHFDWLECFLTQLYQVIEQINDRDTLLGMKKAVLYTMTDVTNNGTVTFIKFTGGYNYFNTNLYSHKFLFNQNILIF